MADTVDIVIGKNIRMQRTLRGWNQTYLGELMGVSFQQIQKYERGVDSVKPSKLKLLSELFGCTIHDLFYDSESFPDSDEIITPGRLETVKIRSLIRHFIRIESPALQDHACAIMRTLASTERK